MKVSDYARERIKMLQASIPDPQMRDRDLSMLLDLHVGKGDKTIAELIDMGVVYMELVNASWAGKPPLERVLMGIDLA
jgi:hypothetical protein